MLGRRDIQPFPLLPWPEGIIGVPLFWGLQNNPHLCFLSKKKLFLHMQADMETPANVTEQGDSLLRVPQSGFLLGKSI